MQKTPIRNGQARCVADIENQETDYEDNKAAASPAPPTA
jgi:hypothetical protein